MTLKECYAALGLGPGAGMTEIKSAYRKLAFSLHPDLNPNVPDASRRFQIVNEAYVQLSKAIQDGTAQSAASANMREEATARAREEAKKAYSKARQGAGARTSSGSPGAGAQQRSSGERSKEDVFRDILNDPFARRVFEDIYSHINKEADQRRNTSFQEDSPSFSGTASRGPARNRVTRPVGNRQEPPGVLDKMKGWLRKQIDDEQIVRLPAASLVPGARIRLEIQHGFAEKPQVLEITLPADFSPNKPMRLKGMGRRVGNWRGDLYVKIEPY